MILEFWGLLFFHWIADFVLQSDRVAKNKSTNWWVLGEHVIGYSLALSFGALGLLLARDMNMDSALNIAVPFLAVTMITHGITDAITSRINSALWKAQKVHYFFVSVGFDQLIHQTTLLVTWVYLVG